MSTEPTTEAGKAAVASYYANPKGLAIRSYIDGIEAEAREQGAREERERLRRWLDRYVLDGDVRMAQDLYRWLDEPTDAP